jgi:hypothetical protein
MISLISMGHEKIASWFPPGRAMRRPSIIRKGSGSYPSYEISNHFHEYNTDRRKWEEAIMMVGLNMENIRRLAVMNTSNQVPIMIKAWIYVLYVYMHLWIFKKSAIHSRFQLKTNRISHFCNIYLRLIICSSVCVINTILPMRTYNILVVLRNQFNST